jgi:U11/U12 small nuclear ribonucleoprotein 35 kDa protein
MSSYKCRYVNDLGYYDPLMVSSINGDNTQPPHDRAIFKALKAKYKPNLSSLKETTTTKHSNCTLFIGRINLKTNEATLIRVFSQFGNIKLLRLVRDVITGISKGYAFVEYETSHEADECYSVKTILIDGYQVIIDNEYERELIGWKPRRLGGGFGGNKKSGQLRFG